jgi:hypothetical protein
LFGLWTFVHDFGASARAIDERVSLRLGLNVGQRCSAYRVSREFLVFSELRVSAGERIHRRVFSRRDAEALRCSDG